MRKRFLAIMMTIVMVLTMVPAAAAYGAETQTSDIWITANGGTIKVAGESTSDWWTKLPDGEKLIIEIDSISAEFWTDRAFQGWQIYEWGTVEDPDGSYEDWILHESKLFSHDELLEYPLPAKELKIEAVWEGLDSDFYSEVLFDMYGGEIKVDFGGDTPDMMESWVEYMKESDVNGNATVGDNLTEIGTELLDDPVKASDEFEGWLKFIIHVDEDYNQDYELESETAYTTEQIMAQTVPDDDIMYVAKWKNVLISEYTDYYLGKEVNVAFDANGGELSVDTVDGTTVEAAAWDFWCRSGDRIGEYIEGLGIIGDYDFLGWDLYNQETKEFETYEMSGEDVFDYILGDDSVVFIARWADESSDAYTPYVELDYNGGEVTVGEGDEAFTTGSDWYEIMNDASVVGDLVEYDPGKVKYWDGKREFVGWAIYTMYLVEYEDWIEEEKILSEECATTEEMMKYELPKNGNSLCIEAIWKGDDQDYITEIGFDGYGGSIVMTFADEEEQWNEEFYNNWFEFMENKETVKEQLEIVSMSDPVMEDVEREGAKFEGWLKFNVIHVKTGDIELYPLYDLDSEKIYTTNEILNQTIPHDDVFYVAKWSDIEIDEYDLNEFDPDYLQVEYWFYNEDGEMDCVPMTMKVDGKSTYKQLLDRMSSKLQHMEGLECTGWEYNGNMGELGSGFLDQVAVGTWLNGTAKYNGKGVVSIDGMYTNVEGETEWACIPVIFTYGDTFQTAYEKAVSKLPAADKHDPSCGWTGKWLPAEDLSQKIPTDQIGVYIDLYAEYENANVTIQYTYRTKSGEIKTIIKEERLDMDVSIQDYFENIVLPDDAAIPEGEVTWSVNRFGGEIGSPSETGGSFAAALNYDGYETVFVNRAFVDANCEPCEVYDDVYYIPETLADQDAVNNFLGEALTAVDKKYGDSSKDFQLKGYKLHNIYFDDEAEYGGFFVETSTYYMEAEYDKALMYVQKNDGTVEKIVKPVGEYYTLPMVDGNCQGIWDIGAPFRGGAYVISGKAVKAESPYRTFINQYNVEFAELTDVPENVEMTLDEIKAAMKNASIETDSLDASKVVIEYKDVQLQERIGEFQDDEQWGEVNPIYFPNGGIVVYLPYPEGTSAATHDFTVTHMLTGMGEAGEIEVLAAEETEYGLKVKMKSMSPVAIAYEGTAPAVPEVPDIFEDTDNVRVAGANRYATSAVISQKIVADDAAKAIVLVNGLDFADALAAGTLAEAVDAPILMVNGTNGAIDDTVKAEINRIDSNHDAKIYIIGGQKAVNPNAETNLKAMGYKAESIERVFGSNRYETAVKVAGKVEAKTAFIAYGMNFPDALGGGGAAAQNDGVILFTGTASLDLKTKAYLQSRSFDNIVILGGTGVVSANVEKELKAINPNTTRISGNNRFATSVAVAEKFFPKADTIVVATGFTAADALAGSPLASYYDAPIVLVDTVHNTVSPELKAYIESAGVKNMAVLGGEKALTPALYNQLKALLK